MHLVGINTLLIMLSLGPGYHTIQWARIPHLGITREQVGRKNNYKGAQINGVHRTNLSKHKRHNRYEHFYFLFSFFFCFVCLFLALAFLYSIFFHKSVAKNKIQQEYKKSCLSATDFLL
jgi:hypothetical protein